MNKAQFFQRQTADQIKKGREAIEAPTDLLGIVESLKKEDKYFLRIKNKLHHYRNSKHFFREGNYIRMNVNKNEFPSIYQEQFLSKIESPYHAGYRYIFNGREVRIPLTSCVHGAKLYSYIQNFSGGITIKKFINKGKNGAQIIVEVPSRTPKRKNYKFKFVSFPLTEQDKFRISYSLDTKGHNCEDKLYTDISENMITIFDDHEVAAYLCLIDYFKNKKNNKIPGYMNLFAIPRNNIIDLDKTLEAKVVIEKPNKKGDFQDYPLTEAEEELFFWASIGKYHFANTFNRKSSDGLLKDADWS